MVLPFFPRKRKGEPPAEPPLEPAEAVALPATEEPEAAPRPRRRRRSRAKTAKATPEAGVASAEVEAPPEEAPAAGDGLQAAEEPEAAPRPRRRRRSRAKATKAAPETPPEPPSLEELLTRQSALLESLAERQLAALRSIERSLTSLERRVAGGQNLAQRPRVGIFVDVPNIVYAADRLGVALDFGRLLRFLTRDRELVRASAYAPIGDDPSRRLEEQRFVHPFVDHGYRIVTKPLKRFANGSMKANFDVELAMDVLTMADRLDVVCLVSGDGDFRRLVELVASRGVRVEVAAFPHSISAELRAICDHYIDLGEHLEELKAR